MANIFIDSTATGANTGVSTDAAYNTISGLAQNFSGENYVWIRRATAFTLSGNATITNTTANQNNNTKFAAWPRGARSLTGTWTQGERVVSGISGLTPTFLNHAARYLKNNSDGNYYLITAIACKIVLSGYTQAFAKYETVTSSGGAIGKIIRWDSATSTLWVVVRSGTFANGETLSGDGKVQEAATKTAGAGTISTVAASDGFVILQDYAGSTASSAAGTIKEDELYSIAQAIDDSIWTVKKTVCDADSDALPAINVNSYYVSISAYYSTFYNIYFYGGNTTYGALRIREAFELMLKGCILYNTLNYAHVTNESNTGINIVSCVGKGVSTGSTNKFITSVESLTLIRDCSFYGFGDYGVELKMGGFIENCNIGVEDDNGDYDIQNQCGIIKGFDIQCGGKNGALRTSSYDSSKDWSGIHNWQRVLAANIRKVPGGIIKFVDPPSTPPSSSPIVMQFQSAENSNYVTQNDIIAAPLSEIPLYLSAGSHTIKIYIQNFGWGNFNSVDSVNNSQLWFNIIYPKQWIDSTKYKISSDESGNYEKSISSSNPVGNRLSSSDWTSYLYKTITLPIASVVLLRLMARTYSSSGVIYIDPIPEVS